MTISSDNHDSIRSAVRSAYAGALQNEGCCSGASCCSPIPVSSLNLGYSAEELAAVPEGANLGLGCGNPQAIAALKPGEIVLDLGSGAGFDCFLAARAVGASGRVIGVDMTPEMLNKARSNLASSGIEHLEFRLGEIEYLPLADASVDVILSNCVINLSPNKPQVFAEAFRVLRPGGRLAISDVVATIELPPEMRQDLALYTGCMAGASHIDELAAILTTAGFEEVRITPKEDSHEFIRQWAPGRAVTDYVVSASIEGRRPG